MQASFFLVFLFLVGLLGYASDTLAVTSATVYNVSKKRPIPINRVFKPGAWQQKSVGSLTLPISFQSLDPIDYDRVSFCLWVPSANKELKFHVVVTFQSGEKWIQPSWFRASGLRQRFELKFGLFGDKPLDVKSIRHIEIEWHPYSKGIERAELADVALLGESVEPVSDEQVAQLASTQLTQQDLADSTAPEAMRFFLNNKGLVVEDFSSATPVVGIEVKELGSGFATWNIQILDASNTIQWQMSGNGNGQIGSALRSASGNVTQALMDGRYVVKATLRDVSGNTQTTVSPTFNVQTALSIKDALNGPNPFNPNQTSTTFQYLLSKSADVDISIFSLSGERIWQRHYSAASEGGVAGLNSVLWNGYTDQGYMVANGPYIVYLIAQVGNEKKVAKIKVLVLK